MYLRKDLHTLPLRGGVGVTRITEHLEIKSRSEEPTVLVVLVVKRSRKEGNGGGKE